MNVIQQQIRTVLESVAVSHGLSLGVIKGETQRLLDSTEWRRAEMKERHKKVGAEIASWPASMRKAAEDWLNQPYQPPADRGEDCNPRW